MNKTDLSGDYPKDWGVCSKHGMFPPPRCPLCETNLSGDDVKDAERERKSGKVSRDLPSSPSQASSFAKTTEHKRDIILDFCSNPDAVLKALHQAGWQVIPKTNLSGGGCEGEPVSSSPSQSLGEIARLTAAKIHWHHVQKPDAYGQEEAARTTKLVLRACEEAVVLSTLNACCEHATIITEQHLKIESLHRQLEEAQQCSIKNCRALVICEIKLQQAEADKERLDALLRMIKDFKINKTTKGNWYLPETREAIDEAGKE